MDEETIQELRAMLVAHANVCRGTATIEKMKVANTEARSKGQDDPYDAAAFAAVEDEIAEYAEELAG